MHSKSKILINDTVITLKSIQSIPKGSIGIVKRLVNDKALVQFGAFLILTINLNDIIKINLS